MEIIYITIEKNIDVFMSFNIFKSNNNKLTVEYS